MFVCLSSSLWQDSPLPPMWFLGSSGNFKQLPFSEIFTSKKIFPLSLTFLDFSWHPKCSKKFTPNFFSPKIFLQWAVGEASRDTMLPSILPLLLDLLVLTGAFCSFRCYASLFGVRGEASPDVCRPVKNRPVFPVAIGNGSWEEKPFL